MTVDRIVANFERELNALRPWKPLQAPITSDEFERSPELFARIVEQFKVGVASRYKATKHKTFCNIFVWDVTRAMGCEIPYWVRPGDGSPARMGESGTDEQNANEMFDWLLCWGPTFGWRETGPAQSLEAANQGMPAVAAWKNPRGHGHIAIIRPGSSSATKPIIAQAGRSNFSSGFLANGFGRKDPRFFFHK